MNSSTYSPNQASASPTNSSSAASSSATSGSFTAKPAAGAPAKEDQASAVREKVSGTFGKIGRGLRSLFQLKDQAQRHPLATILSSAAVLLAIGGSIAVGVLESQRRRTFSYRFKRGLRNARRHMMSRR